MKYKFLRWLWAQRRHFSETYCGEGSYIHNTVQTRLFISNVVKNYDIESVVDLGCGDWNWMKHVNFGKAIYTGIDLDCRFIEANKKKYFYPTYDFICADAVYGKINYGDLVICRDLLLHLPEVEVLRVLQNIVDMKAKFLLSGDQFKV